MKRAFDIVFASIGVVVFCPVWLWLVLLIRWEDRGPVFFRQMRIGKNRKPFSILKFRTMRDNQVTKVGKVLRATGLDETAQFLNVLKGDMSMVGPRPLTQEDIIRLGWDTNKNASRWTVKPGITGLAQVLGGRGARLSWFLDRKYIVSSSFRVDVQLILISFAINLLGKKKVRTLMRHSA
jgi:lipopolysaccharide/colanic/teichoic acid biosynthesis glycosyltransferase